MNTVERQTLNRFSGGIIAAARQVSNSLGCGFLEKVYENALAIELRVTYAASSAVEAPQNIRVHLWLLPFDENEVKKCQAIT